MITTHKIKLDFNLQETTPRIRAVQGDLYTRKVEVSLHSNTVPWIIPEHTTVLIRYRKPDKIVGVYDTLPNGESAFQLKENTVTVTIAPDMLTTAGDVSMIISLIQGEQILSTFEMTLEVQKNHAAGKPSMGAAFISGLLPSPKSAQEGQILAVDKIGVNGAVLALSAIDLPPYNTMEHISVDKEASTEFETVYCLHLSDGTQLCFSVKNGDNGENGKSAYDYAKDAGYTGTEAEFATKMAKGYPNTSVTEYGAKGDGSTNDTAAFQNALANNRVVFVPGGTYVLSGTLVIRENCCLELSQDTVLKFEQTSGNCIEMRGSAVLRGNHAVISAAFGLTGNVICMDTSLDGEPHNSIPPYEKSCPQWKRQRFIYDVNIIKPNANGFNRPLDDDKCNGTAIYMHCDGFASITWMWGIVMSGIRIAGGFAYGIRAYNVDDPNDDMVDDAWNHDMRIAAVIEACEIGVALENCNGAHLDVSIQPNKTTGGTKYAKQGVMLSDSRFVDMMRSRVWDWHVARTDSAEYKHIALYSNCRGLLLDDFLVTEHPNTDIRDEIYTDTPSNFDTMTILQEPANKWFKSIDNVPYFNDGTNNRKLMLSTDKFTSEQMEFISPADGYYTYEDNFTNLVNGYTEGKCLGSGTDQALITNAEYVTTDFIPIDGAAIHTYRIGGEGIIWKDSYGYGRIAWYDADKKQKGSTMPWSNVDKNQSSEYYPAWVEDEKAAAAFVTKPYMASTGAAYFRISALGKGENLIVTIDEPIDYKAIWHGEPKRLDDSIKIKAENVVGLGSGSDGVSSWNDLTDKPFGSEIKTILAETTVEIDPEDGVGIIPAEFILEVGKEYTIRYNGTTYTISNGIVLGDIFAIGNLGIIDSEIAMTEEPFCLGYSPIDEDENGEPIYGWAVIPLDSATTVTLSIVGEVVTKIPDIYVSLPTQYCAFEVYAGSQNTVHIDMDTTSLVDAILNYHPIYVNLLRCKDTDDPGVIRSLECLQASATYGSITASETTMYSVSAHLFKCVASGMEKWNLPIDLTVLSPADGTVKPIFIRINSGASST